MIMEYPDDMLTTASNKNEPGEGLTLEKLLEAKKILDEMPPPPKIYTCAGCNHLFFEIYLALWRDNKFYCEICWTDRYVGNK